MYSVLKSFRLSAEVLRYHAAFLTSVNWFPGLDVSRHLTEVHDSNLLANFVPKSRSSSETCSEALKRLFKKLRTIRKEPGFDLLTIKSARKHVQGHVKSIRVEP